MGRADKLQVVPMVLEDERPMAKGKRVADKVGDKLPSYKSVKVADLVPYARNSRTHTDAQVAQVAASIKEFGFINPVVTDGDNGIVAGHCRVLAAQKLGMTEVPCIEASWLTEAQRRAYVIADNKLALNAGWDDEMLKIELSELQLGGFDLSIAGFSLGEIGSLTTPSETKDAEPQIDRADELLKTWKVERGQVWQIGNHRLMCGDSTSAEDVKKLLNGCIPKSLISDPPYGLVCDPSWYGGVTAFGTVVQSPTKSTGAPEWDAKPFDPSHLFGIAKDIALFGANFFCTRLPEDGTWWVWDKHMTASGSTPAWYGMPFELIWMNGKRAHKIIRHLWAGFTRKAQAEDKERYHPTQKPVGLMRDVIEYLTSDGDSIVDLYAGSGTTLVAAENCGRKCYAMEIEPKYVAVCLQRLSDIGLTPELTSGR